MSLLVLSWQSTHFLPGSTRRLSSETCASWQARHLPRATGLWTFGPRGILLWKVEQSSAGGNLRERRGRSPCCLWQARQSFFRTGSCLKADSLKRVFVFLWHSKQSAPPDSPLLTFVAVGVQDTRSTEHTRKQARAIRRK